MTPLYRRVLGPRFAALPPQVQALHDLTSTAVWRGTADVERGTGLLSRLAGWITSLPAPGQGQPLTVTFATEGEAEVWTRRFGASTFRSVQFDRGGELRERAGPVTFRFEPRVAAGALSLHLRGLRVLGLPVPPFLQPDIATREWEVDGRYHFKVEAHLPLAGLLVRYAGTLARTGADASA